MCLIEAPAEILAHHATRIAADSFCAWRKRIKKPLTETAAIRIATSLAAINAAGGDASDALGMAEEQGWQSIRADWYWRNKGGNGNINGAGNGNAASVQIANAARFARPQGDDCF